MYDDKSYSHLANRIVQTSMFHLIIINPRDREYSFDSRKNRHKYFLNLLTIVILFYFAAIDAPKTDDDLLHLRTWLRIGEHRHPRTAVSEKVADRELEATDSSTTGGAAETRDHLHEWAMLLPIGQTSERLFSIELVYKSIEHHGSPHEAPSRRHATDGKKILRLEHSPDLSLQRLTVSLSTLKKKLSDWTIDAVTCVQSCFFFGTYESLFS